MCPVERYIPAEQSQPKPQLVRMIIVLVSRIQESSTGDNNFVN